MGNTTPNLLGYLSQIRFGGGIGRIGSLFSDLFGDSFDTVIISIFAFVVAIAILAWLLTFLKAIFRRDWYQAREELYGLFQVLGCLGMLVAAIWAFSWVI